jgi:hypothetical protein
VIALVSLFAIVYYNPQVAGLFAVLGIIGGGITYQRQRSGSPAAHDAMLQRPAGD